MFFRTGLTIVIATCLISSLNAESMNEYRVKAAFLYNFSQFVDWPPEAFRNGEESFALCVLGKDPFGRFLDDVVAGKAIAGRPIVVRRIDDAHQAIACQILFVSASAGKHVLSILANAKQTGVLTVGEAGNATSRGLIINFTLTGEKVRFEINTGAAEDEKLHLSPKLLSLATLVRKQ